MAKNSFLGTAPLVAKVISIVPANVGIADVFKVTLTDDAGHSSLLSYTAIAATVKDVVEGLCALAVAAKAAGTLPWTLVTATEDDTQLILTAVTAGVPVYAATATVDGDANNTQTLTATTTTANSGPSDADCAANWSLGAVPVATNDVYFENTDVDVLYGLGAFAAVAFNSLNVAQSFTGKIGSADVAASGYFRCLASTCEIGYHYGYGTPAGSGRLKIDLGTTACAVTIHNSSGSPTESSRPAVRLLAVNAGSVLHVRKGLVGLACETPAEVSTVSAVNVSYVASQETDADVLLGAGVTITSLTKTGGKAVLQSAATAVVNRAGSLTTAGAGAITTLTVEGGTVTSNSTGTITTCNADGGTIDFTKSTSARTVTTLAARNGSTATVKYDPAVLTVTNKLAPAGPISMQLAAA
jgi:hypothetical protein